MWRTMLNVVNERSTNEKERKKKSRTHCHFRVIDDFNDFRSMPLVLKNCRTDQSHLQTAFRYHEFRHVAISICQTENQTAATIAGVRRDDNIHIHLLSPQTFHCILQIAQCWRCLEPKFVWTRHLCDNYWSTSSDFHPFLFLSTWQITAQHCIRTGNVRIQKFILFIVGKYRMSVTTDTCKFRNENAIKFTNIRNEWQRCIVTHF